MEKICCVSLIYFHDMAFYILKHMMIENGRGKKSLFKLYFVGGRLQFLFKTIFVLKLSKERHSNFNPITKSLLILF